MKLSLVLILIIISGGSIFAWDEEDSFDAPKTRQNREMRDFLGAVHKGQGALNITSGNLAQGSEGAIVRSGNTFTTPRGVYVKVGDTWLLPDGDGAVIRAGNSFLSPDETVVKSGNTYLSSQGNAVVAGQTVLRNYSKSKKDDDE